MNQRYEHVVQYEYDIIHQLQIIQDMHVQINHQELILVIDEGLIVVIIRFV